MTTINIDIGTSEQISSPAITTWAKKTHARAAQNMRVIIHSVYTF